jgi:hypothetical protein
LIYSTFQSFVLALLHDTILSNQVIESIFSEETPSAQINLRFPLNHLNSPLEDSLLNMFRRNQAHPQNKNTILQSQSRELCTTFEELE